MFLTSNSNAIIFLTGNEDMGYDKFVCVEPVQSTPKTIPVGKFKVSMCLV